MFFEWDKDALISVHFYSFCSIPIFSIIRQSSHSSAHCTAFPLDNNTCGHMIHSDGHMPTFGWLRLMNSAHSTARLSWERSSYAPTTNPHANDFFRAKIAGVECYIYQPRQGWHVVLKMIQIELLFILVHYFDRSGRLN